VQYATFFTLPQPRSLPSSSAMVKCNFSIYHVIEARGRVHRWNVFVFLFSGEICFAWLCRIVQSMFPWRKLSFIGICYYLRLCSPNSNLNFPSFSKNIHKHYSEKRKKYKGNNNYIGHMAYFSLVYFAGSSRNL
jgi:hypothetical protein